MDEWTALIRDAHQGYITWEQFEQHVQILHDNAQAHGCERDLGAPREGPALLQGLAICGRCGERMTIRYHVHDTQRVPDYMCQRRSINEGVGRPCQQINGAELDQAIGRLLVETVTPVTLQVALAVQKELEDRSGEFDRLRRQEIERASYEVDLARRRYMRVDPDNRLVADSLEAEWNLALRALAAAQERYEKQCETRSGQLNKKQRESIMALAQDFPRLWNDPQTPEREKKRMARLLIADVTLLKDTEIIARVRFKGGATRVLRLSLPKPSWQLRQTPTAVVAEIDRLLEGHTDHETAELLNASGMRSGEGLPFRRLMVRRIRIDYGLKTQYERLRARGLLSATEIAKYLKVCTATIADWRRAGLLKAYQYNDNGQYLYERPGVDAPRRFAHKNKARREAAVDVTTPWHD